MRRNGTICIIGLAVLALFLSVMASAQTVTAGSSGDFGTLADAISSFRSGGSNAGNPDPNVINLLDASYDETLPAVDVQLTINGQVGRSTVLATEMVYSANAMQLLPPDGQEIILNDLILLPSSGHGGNFINSASGGGTVTFNNCIISQNYSGGPASLDGLTEPPPTPTQDMNDDAIVCYGSYAAKVINLNQTIITAVNGPSPSPEGIWLNGSGITLNVGPGCVISYIGDRGISANGSNSVNLIGTKEEPIIIYKNNTNNDPGAAGDCGGICKFDAGGTLTMEYVICDSNLNDAVTGDGEWDSVAISHCIFSNNSDCGIDFVLGPSGDFVISDCTFFNNGAKQLEAEDPANPITIFNTIFAGAGKVGINLLTAGAINVSRSALVTAGPHALSPAIDGEGTVNLTNVIGADPEFVSTAFLVGGAVNDDFLDVNSSAYSTAGAGNVPLAGGADYVGPPPAAAQGVWILYQ
jgi:hypothetical protein